ncbi:hypothetical protein LCGC14_1023030 [marine sediment metagenome]|uniref:RecA family profile 2 domain-containing protein n=1 Tax=marine sediment metagenome TaxID=412755 RepID=A0A0F9NIH4_9ZZZZ
MPSDLEALRDRINGELKADLVFGDDPSALVTRLELGVPVLDETLGGGIAYGRITEVIGAESTGKTLLALFAIKAAQAEGRPVVFIDVERSWEPTWADAIGIDLTELLVSQPRTGEDAFNIAHAVVRDNDNPGLLIIDSLAAMTAKAEVEDNDDGMQQQFVGLHARMINRGLRTLNSENHGWAVIMINQIREAVGVRYGSPEVLPGGKGQRFVAWQIIRCRRAGWIEEGPRDAKTKVGYQWRIVLEKNKQGEPFRECTLPFYFTGDIDEMASLLDVAIATGVIERRGAYYNFGDLKVQGKKGLRDAVSADEIVFDQIKAALVAKEAEEGF